MHKEQYHQSALDGGDDQCQHDIPIAQLDERGKRCKSRQEHQAGPDAEVNTRGYDVLSMFFG